MADLNRYPNYIGVETELVNSAIIKLNYTGESSKSVVVTSGGLVSIGHVVNKNGVLSYELTMGIVKSIGSDPVARTIQSSYLTSGSVSNPYYLVIDKSNTYASDVITIYVRDIRDIIVGPMAEGNYAKGDMYGDILPEVNEANKDLYLGRFFYLTTVAELYYYNETGWLKITTYGNVDSSPLITSVVDPNTNDKTYTLKNNISVFGSNIANGTDLVYALNVPYLNDSYIKMCLTGNTVSYQLHLTGSSLLSDNSGEEIIESEIVSISNLGSILPSHDVPININRVNVNGEWKDVYHRITPEGKLSVAYPNVAGITSLDLFGSYII